jgi:acetyl esterase
MSSPAYPAGMNPQLLDFLRDWQQAWSSLPAGSGPAQRRAHFETVAKAMREPDAPGLQTREHWIDVPEGGQVRVREFRPADAQTPAPALIYMHGGAWMQGSPETHWDITGGIASRNRQAVFSVDYALAPEKPFPRAVQESTAVVRWAFAQAGALGLDAQAIAIGGDSAGANLAASQTLVHRDTDCRLCAQLLVYPAVDFSMNRPSHRENADGPVVTVASMPMVNASYCPNPADLQNPLAAPLLAESLANLPPAYVAVAQFDPLRDEGTAYAERLQASGVATQLDRGLGLIHGYLRSKAYCEAARQSFERMADWLQQA